MKVGSRADYGLRALVYLAAQSETGHPVQVHAIAKRQQIPEDYLRQLLVNLRTAGLIKSVRGPHGGYLLARDANDISMGEVIDTLEGGVGEMHCGHLREEREACDLLAGCNVRGRWGDAVKAMKQVLYETSLQQLISGEAQS